MSTGESSFKRKASSESYLLEVENVCKNFSGIRALRGVSFSMEESEVIGLVGDNGAGKSTLMKIVSGAYFPDSGRISIKGKEVKHLGPGGVRELGVKMVYQDLALADILDVPKNIFMGMEITKFGILDDRKMNKQTRAILKRLKTTIKSLRQPVCNLSGGQQHAVAIGRVFIGKAPSLLLLDEPTAGLGVEESGKLLDLIRTLREQRISIILISHNLDHIFQVADRIIVLRNGEKVGERLVKEISRKEVVEMMLGVV